MARIETTYAVSRIRERVSDLAEDYAVLRGADDDASGRCRLAITAEVSGLCFGLGLLTGEDADSLYERIWIERAAA